MNHYAIIQYFGLPDDDTQLLLQLNMQDWHFTKEAEAFVSCIGIDRDQRPILTAAENLRSLSLLYEMQYERIGFPVVWFDYILGVNILTERSQPIMRELYRIAKPSCRLCFVEPEDSDEDKIIETANIHGISIDRYKKLEGQLVLVGRKGVI